VHYPLLSMTVRLIAVPVRLCLLLCLGEGPINGWMKFNAGFKLIAFLNAVMSSLVSVPMVQLIGQTQHSLYGDPNDCERNDDVAVRKIVRPSKCLYQMTARSESSHA
jgi:hypothetical protein